MNELPDLWGVRGGSTTLLRNGRSMDITARAFACPRGVLPGDLDWSRGGLETVTYTKRWTNLAKDRLGLSTGTQVRVGCTWSYGGCSTRFPGLFLRDAYLWAVLDYCSAGSDVQAQGGFGQARSFGNSAGLPGWIVVTMEFLGNLEEEHRFDIQIRGNGAGDLRPA